MFYNYHPEDIAEVADGHKLDPKQVAQPMQYMFHGLATLSKFRWALEALLHKRHQREVAMTRKNLPDDPDADIFHKLDAQYEEEKLKARQPLWKLVSGMPFAEELPHAPRERRRALTIVINAVELLIKHELEFAEDDGQAIANSHSYMLAADEFTAPCLLEPKQRTVYWSPIPGICAALGLSRIALTRMGQELVGRSAHELVDDIVVKKVERKMKAILHPQLRELLAQELGEHWHTKLKGVKARDIWHKLKRQRTEPEYSRVVYAQELGFPTYQRLCRACFTKYRKHPHQLELLVIEEFIRDCAEQQGTGERGQGSEAVLPSPLGGEGPGVRAGSPVAEQRSGARADGAGGSTTVHRSSTSIKLPIATEPQQVQKNTGGQSETKVG